MRSHNPVHKDTWNVQDLNMTMSAESAMPWFATRFFCADGLFAIADIIRAIFLTYFRNVRFDCWSIGSCPTRRVMSFFRFLKNSRSLAQWDQGFTHHSWSALRPRSSQRISKIFACNEKINFFKCIPELIFLSSRFVFTRVPFGLQWPSWTSKILDMDGRTYP